MRTNKDISTISYNTEEFLKLKLNQLLNDKIINYWCYIKHDPEEDEKKNHIHLFIKPNCQVDTMDLENYFIEFLPGEKLPRKTIFFEKSKSDDWILYNQHFRPYLISKMEDRIYFYQKEDFVFSDLNSFEFLYSHAFNASDWAKDNQVLARLRDPNVSPADIILSGQVSWYHSTQVQALTNLIQNFGSTFRGYHKGHE